MTQGSWPPESGATSPFRTGVRLKTDVCATPLSVALYCGLNLRVRNLRSRKLHHRKNSPSPGVPHDRHHTPPRHVRRMDRRPVAARAGGGRGEGTQPSPQGGQGWAANNANTQAVRLSNDSVSYVTSGLLDEMKSKVISHLHKAMRPINQLRMMEDSLIIYRLARAPERRIFYVDVGNLPKGKAEAYINTLMTRYRNKLVYDQSTGELKDQRKHMSMLDDFWLPRREGGRGTEVSTLPGGSNLGEIDDIRYFQRKVYQALNVPVSRLEQEQAYSLGRATEITREEIKFQKFITRLRMRYAKVFTGILRQQLVLKGIITDIDWVDHFHNNIRVEYYKDNHYTELKDAEVLAGRLNLMDQATQYVGEYISKDWVMKNIFRFDEKERADMKLEVDKEIEDGDVDPDKERESGGDGYGEPQQPQVNPIDPSKEKQDSNRDSDSSSPSRRVVTRR